uniref:Tc1-like transposase DDE domain-containing protein n=1 Tax=Pundamilia nyererei TaxID=303518 RepID=A0A3B4GED8_9CICH
MRLRQDNDPKHKSKLWQNYLRKKRTRWSPDLNHIKPVCNELDRRVKAKIFDFYCGKNMEGFF